MIIGISGPSGVGKSIISSLIKKFMSKNNPLLICGDDYHKWERNNNNWNYYTHYNPAANNLEKALEDLQSLKNGNDIKIKHYNHDTGFFDDSINIHFSNTIIFEGLHSLSDIFKNLIDLKIYVDTDEILKTEWKIKRDTQRRGYTKEQVLNIIKKRKNDEIKYIIPQKQNADIIIKFSLDEKKSVVFSYICNNQKYKTFIEEFSIFYNNIQNFITLCKTISYDYSLVQNKGGNISCKLNNQEMLITCSGNSLTDVNVDVNYTIFNYYQFLNEYLRFDNYFDVVKSCSYQSIASMESGIHAIFKNKFVVHLHPIHLNTILCSKNCETILKDIFIDLKYDFCEYIDPGENLYNYFKNKTIKNNVYFLQNHGLIVVGDEIEDVLKIINFVNDSCKSWIVKKSMSFLPYYKTKIDKNIPPLFPDAALIEKIKDVNLLIYKNIVDCDLIPNFLSEKNIENLKNMKFENYRMNK